MRNYIKILLALIVLILWTGCGSDDSTTPKEQEKSYLSGVFLDSPVEGLLFISGDTTGYTNSEGTFIYEEGEDIEFRVGAVSLGKVVPKETISPIDLGGADATINTSLVKNIASLLQSLDSDGNTSNGIAIQKEVSDEIESNSIDLSSSNFGGELQNLLTTLNAGLSLDLEFVHPFYAARNLATSLELEDEVILTSTVKSGRRWEDGFYFAYNSTGYGDPEVEYVFNINADSVVYNFGGGTAYIFEVEYTSDTLFGIGSLYQNINETPELFYLYRNRISSPGYIVDHNDSTFIGYFNLRKTSGNPDEIQGTYKQFLILDGKKDENSDPFIVTSLNSELEISELDENDSITFTTTSFLDDPATVETFKMHANAVLDEELFLVLLDGSEYIYATRNSELYPGLISYKVED
ncbi:hypothetical protein [Ekhidna sp.]